MGKQFSLRAQIVALLVIGGIFPLVLISVFFYINSSQIILTNFSQQTKLLLSKTVYEIDSDFDRFINSAARIKNASLYFFLHQSDLKELEKQVKNYLETNKDIERIVVLGKDGRVLSSQGILPYFKKEISDT